MSLVPDFEIGLWNAWILQVIFLFAAFVPDFLMGKEAKLSMKRMSQSVPLSKSDKILAYSTHVIIMPFVLIYSIFLPMKLGTVWLYIGLPIFILSGVMYIATIINIANTPVNKPVTIGIYRIMRHPIYFSGFLMYIGIGIACASWIVILCALLWIAFFYVVVPAEEDFLLKKYGDAYRVYIDRTPRWIGIPKS
jgi:protein-S-isoprenylcysteine O-methyltransferase Ste14